MFRIDGDYRTINVTNTTESQYINGTTVPVVKYQINGSYELIDTINRFQKLEKEWQQFQLEKQNEKLLIETNPAVKEAYKNYLTIAALAKEYNSAT